MEDLIKCYPIQNDEYPGLIYGCLIMNKSYYFNPVIFQHRLDRAKEDLRGKIDNYEELIYEVLSKHSDDYKGVSYISTTMIKQLYI